MSKYKFTVNDITEGGLMVSFALILNFIKIPIGATGGSINLQMFPLLVFSLRKGWFKGFLISGLVYGAVTCFADGSGNIINFPLDYLLGFGSCCIMGLLKEKAFVTNEIKSICFILLGGLLATACRLAFSTLSSIIIYGYSFFPALIYNIIYIIPSGIIATVLVCLIRKKLKLYV